MLRPLLRVFVTLWLAQIRVNPRLAFSHHSVAKVRTISRSIRSVATTAPSFRCRNKRVNPSTGTMRGSRGVGAYGRAPLRRTVMRLPFHKDTYKLCRHIPSMILCREIATGTGVRYSRTTTDTVCAANIAIDNIATVDIIPAWLTSAFPLIHSFPCRRQPSIF